jgi:NADPH-dependent 2,4-dienoyl-CoA reductase/sulfur reductase-like enzyme
MSFNNKKYDVIIIGSGPAGLGTALKLAKTNLSVLILERRANLGGVAAKYVTGKGTPTYIDWPRARMRYGQQFAESLIDKINQTNIEICLESQVLAIDKKNKVLTVVKPGEKFEVRAKAIVLACGGREKNSTERGWIYGSRPDRVYFTMNIIDLMNRDGMHSLKDPIIIGSDILAYAAALKLEGEKTTPTRMIDKSARKINPLERLFLKKWINPDWLGQVAKASIQGFVLPNSVVIDQKELSCDGVVISGALVANSELALVGDLGVELPSRKPVLSRDQMFSAPGWFAAGNMVGGIHGGYWCYLNGRKVAGYVKKYLVELNHS